jgi:hypothetical protein
MVRRITSAYLICRLSGYGHGAACPTKAIA